MFKKIFIMFLTSLLVLHAVYSSGSGEKKSANKEPSWVSDPYTVYSEQVNLAVVGRGSSRDIAEKDALGRLVSLFGQSIQVDEKVSMTYQEAAKSGVAASWSETTTIDTRVATSADMETLVGAEIGEVWDNGQGIIFAAALLNKARAYLIYSEMIRSNQAMIENLIDMTQEEKNSLEAYARYQFAAAIADINMSYGNLLSVIGRPMQGLKKGDDYRLEALNITREIPVGLTVANDKAGRIQGAFAKALSDLGFRSGGSNSRYVLDVNLVVSPVVLVGNPNVFSRIELKANLMDSSLGTVLVPYDFNSREGHTTQEEADNRAYAAAERRINQEYANILNDYLSSLLPRR